MMNVDIEEIISAVAKHNIRWIRNNFYTEKFQEELSVDILLAELPGFRASQDEGEKVKLPSSLIDFFTKHYANNHKQIEELKEKLVEEFIGEKRILLLHENLNPQIISKIQKVILNTSIGKAICEAFDLSVEPENLVEILETNRNFNFVILCLTKLKDKLAINSILMFLIGYFGVDNVCVIYSNKNEGISRIAQKLGVSCDSYIGLGLRSSG